MRRFVTATALASLLVCPAPVAAQRSPSAAASLTELWRSLQDLSQKVSASVVQIFVTGYSPPDEQDAGHAGWPALQRSSGSGVIVDPDGYIVTNALIVENATRLEVELPFNATGGDPARSILSRRGTLGGTGRRRRSGDGPRRDQDGGARRSADAPEQRPGAWGHRAGADAADCRILPPLRRPTGMVAASVSPEAPFSQQGRLQVGDVIYALNGVSVGTIAELGEAAGRLDAGTAAVLQIEGDGELMFLDFGPERR